MNLAAPTMLWLAAGFVPALVILYFLKLRRRPQEISSTLLWKRAIEDLQANAPFQKLRRNILLLLQLLILAGLIVALAQPESRDETSISGNHVILIDRSASMLARDSQGRSRLDRAKRDAIALVESLKESGLLSADGAEQAMVIAFDVSADVVSTFTSDKAALRRAIESIQPTHAPSGLDEAVKLARAHAPIKRIEDTRGGQPGAIETTLQVGVGTIHVFSDGALPDAPRVLTGVEDEVIYHRVGEDDPVNLAITALRADRGYEDPALLSLFVGLQSTAPSPREVDLEVRINGEMRAYSVPVTALSQSSESGEDARAPGSGSASIQIEYPESALVDVRLVGSALADDALAVDNRGWLVVPPARRLAVAMVTPGNPFLSDWLATLRFSRFEVLTPSEFEDAAADGSSSEFDVFLLDRTLPANGELPPGRYLTLGAVPALGAVVTGTSQSARFVDWSRSHPALRSVNIESVLIAESPIVEFDKDAGVTSIADTNVGPGILEIFAPEVRAIAVVFDPLKSTWPFDVSFPVFVASAINSLGNEAAAGALARQLRPGDVLNDRLPSGATETRITVPDTAGQPIGATTTLTPNADGRVVFGPIDRLGLYKVRWRGDMAAGDVPDGSRSARFFAANLLDTRESDIQPAPSLELAARTVRAEGGRAGVIRRYWPWFVLAALAVILLEWWVYNRKVHV
ncbi:MAG: BatA domain-containing protein [Phycisphaeraceae bacterium]|nr:BatA domain-containing protein [Phycisphaeraceae bacterium]